MTIFRFQQFSVRQEKSAMKVCTDATLFGAMAPVQGGEEVLDIGTGSGLLALMAAQLGASQITGVELAAEAFDEACLNFTNSPWSDRLTAVHGPIQGFTEHHHNRYDLIISNPPFFHNHSKASDPYRRQARHTDLLPYPELIECAERLLGYHGLFYLLLPSHAIIEFSSMALDSGLHRIAQTDLRGHRHNPSKVSCLTFSRQRQPRRYRLLTIYQAERVYTEESEHYLAGFLLRFAQQN